LKLLPKPFLHVPPAFSSKCHRHIDSGWHMRSKTSAQPTETIVCASVPAKMAHWRNRCMCQCATPLGVAHRHTQHKGAEKEMPRTCTICSHPRSCDQRPLRFFSVSLAPHSVEHRHIWRLRINHVATVMFRATIEP